MFPGFSIYIKKFTAKIKVLKLFPMPFSGSFLVLGLEFQTLILFGLLLVSGENIASSFFIWISNFPSSLLKGYPFPVFLATYKHSIGCKFMRSFLGFFCFIDLCVPLLLLSLSFYSLIHYILAAVFIPSTPFSPRSTPLPFPLKKKSRSPRDISQTQHNKLQ